MNNIFKKIFKRITIFILLFFVLFLSACNLDIGSIIDDIIKDDPIGDVEDNNNQDNNQEENNQENNNNQEENNQENNQNLDRYTFDISNTQSYLKLNELNSVIEDEEYTHYLDVVAYIHYFHHLPRNYLTKSEAKALGWRGSGNVWANDKLMYKLIGGDVFYNKEGILPYVNAYYYRELDVDCVNGNRGSFRIVYNSSTYDIYYTNDHYNTFTYMIGE